MLPLHDSSLETPAFVYDESRILAMARLLAQVRSASGCKMLYSIKSLPFRPVLELLAPWMDGFSVSSWFEAKLAAPLGGALHITTPGLRPAEIAEIGALCRFVAFNSLEQFLRLQPCLGDNASPGLRINPQFSFAGDRRFDPCREYSKLGVPLDELVSALAEDAELATRIRGLHFHTMFSARSFEPMKKTVALIEEKLADLLPRLDWINLGGGYLFENERDLTGLMEIAQDLRRRFDLAVYFEPGKGVVGRAGYLVGSVIDLFRRDGKTLAVLDTTVNHHPKAFEYQIRPEPAWAEPERGHDAILAGCTCLAGDLFGEYRFDEPLQLGDRVAFANVGAYSLIKASRFNGYDLPSIYAWDGGMSFRAMKHYGYGEFYRQWTVD